MYRRSSPYPTKIQFAASSGDTTNGDIKIRQFFSSIQND